MKLIFARMFSSSLPAPEFIMRLQNSWVCFLSSCHSVKRGIIRNLHMDLWNNLGNLDSFLIYMKQLLKVYCVKTVCPYTLLVVLCSLAEVWTTQKHVVEMFLYLWKAIYHKYQFQERTLSWCWQVNQYIQH